MKRFFYLLMLAFATAASFSLGGCSKDDDDDDKQEQQQKLLEEQQRQQEEQKKQQEEYEYLATHSTLSVTLVDKTTGKKMAGAQVVLVNVSDNSTVALVVANADGTAKFSELDVNKIYGIACQYNGVTYAQNDGFSISRGDNAKTVNFASTALKIIVKNLSGGLVQGASVKLFATEDDFKKDANSLATSITDANGQVVFYDLQPNDSYYYFLVKYGKTTNNNTDETIGYKCSEGMNTVSCILKEQTGTVILNNNAQFDTGTYKYVILYPSGETAEYTVSKGSSLELPNMPLGSYSVYMEQLDGFSFYATKGTLQKQIVVRDQVISFDTRDI